MANLRLKEVDTIARLCRLSLTDAQRSAMMEQLSSILGYVEKLRELDTNTVEPTNQATDQVNVSRPDIVEEQDSETTSRLLDAAPATENGGIAVPPVL